ncbi:uncharacterized protein LOC100200555 [Hydra vulgaris]|uniref:uncharacterized protein LOC100200555 n=1 Tax=Hydra vulgaris TaxID=6087 RepID=UPI0001926743|nr:uncharacterized protein LOC100200555 [Hydra vulgaris]
MYRVLLISAVEGIEAVEQVNNIYRHLSYRGNDITLFDIARLKMDDEYVHHIDTFKSQVMDAADAIILVTDEFCASLVQDVQSLFTTHNKSKRSSNVWYHNGVCCTILGGSIKNSGVAKQLWEVFSNQHILDFTDLFPYGKTKTYNLDYTKETAQPAVV